MSRYAISDLHGCPLTLMALLDRIGLTTDDQLFLLGDYIDRGPDSQGVLERIRSLTAEGYDLVCLRGNHEQMLLDALDAGNTPWDYAPRPADAAWVTEWMRALPHYHATPGYLLVHAGLNFRAADPLADHQAMLWSRYWESDIDREWLGERTVVYGHTPARRVEVERGVEYMSHNQRVCIDAGCALRDSGFGYLVALNLDTREATFMRRVD